MSRISPQRRPEFHPFPVKEQGPSPRHAYQIKPGTIVPGFGAAPAKVRLEAVAPPGFRLKATAVRDGAMVKVFVTAEPARNRPRAHREKLDVTLPFLPPGSYTVRYVDPRGKTVGSTRYDAMSSV